MFAHHDMRLVGDAVRIRNDAFPLHDEARSGALALLFCLPRHEPIRARRHRVHLDNGPERLPRAPTPRASSHTIVSAQRTPTSTRARSRPHGCLSRTHSRGASTSAHAQRPPTLTALRSAWSLHSAPEYAERAPCCTDALGPVLGPASVIFDAPCSSWRARRAGAPGAKDLRSQRPARCRCGARSGHSAHLRGLCARAHALSARRLEARMLRQSSWPAATGLEKFSYRELRSSLTNVRLARMRVRLDAGGMRGREAAEMRKEG